MRRLIIRPGAVGDCIVSLPALEYLQPAEIWAPEQNLPLLRHLCPVRSIAATGLDRLEIEGQDHSVLAALRGFDEIVSWYGAARPEFRQSVADLPFRFLTALPGEGQHAVDFYLRQVCAPPGASPLLPWNSRPQGFAAIHPFSGSARKNWPMQGFQAVAARLPLPVEWCAGPEESLDNARRFETLDQLAEWLSTASLYLGNDSGITHLAAACGVPTVAIFTGGSDERVWAPRGEQVAVLVRPSVDEVVTAGTQLLAR